MNPPLALARAELTMLTRNRTAAVNALLLPLAAGALLLAKPPPTGSVGTAATMLLAFVCLTMAVTATITLVARRQQHLLQRWRTAPAAPWAVLLATLTPTGVLFAAQAGALLAILAYATGSTPARPALVALAVALGGALGCAAAFVTAAFTRTVEAANLTMLPVLAALFGGVVWATTAAPGEITWAMRATGGGALAELVQLGWAGTTTTQPLTAAAPSTLILAALTTAAVLLARYRFRWEPRH